MAEYPTCSIWEKNWTASVPDAFVEKVLRKGLIKKECLPRERLERMGLVEKEETKLEEEGVV